MERRSLISTGLIGFGVGLVVGSGFRSSSRFAAGMFEHFGFEVDEMLWSMLEAGGAENPEKETRDLRVKLDSSRRVTVRRLVKRRAFSNIIKRSRPLELLSA